MNGWVPVECVSQKRYDFWKEMQSFLERNALLLPSEVEDLQALNVMLLT